MFSVVTVSRQMGSGGSRFAKALSERCGFQLIWREVINKAAINIGSPDVALAMIDELGLLGLCPEPKVCDAYIKAVSQVMEDYVRQKNVILVGRASQVILGHLPNVLHIRVIADLDSRINYICESRKVNQDAARKQITKSDLYHQEYMQKFYQVNWNDASLYDLVLNTTKISIPQLVDFVSDLLKVNEGEFLEKEW